MTIVGDDRWDADVILVAVNPASLGLIETAAVDYAIQGEYTENVTIENLIVEKYAVRSSHGAIHAHNGSNWNIINVTAQDNHGAGITVGPGTLVDGAKVLRNGQIGIAGYGQYRQGPLKGVQGSRPVVVRNTEIAYNLTLDYWWGWEGGGTKFKETEGMIFEDNWSHHNGGPGAWWDVYNNGATIQNNLVEHNEVRGIMYEISHGPTVISGNVAHNNGNNVAIRYLGSQIYVSNSTDVTVRDNTVWGGTRGIVVRNDGSRYPLASNVQVFDNDITVVANGWSGFKQVNGVDGAKWTNGTVKFHHNTHRVAGGASANVFFWGSRMKFGSWQNSTINGAGSKVINGGHPTVASPVNTSRTYGAS